MKHLNPYGTYKFPVETKYARSGFRPLRASDRADQSPGCFVDTREECPA